MVRIIHVQVLLAIWKSQMQIWKRGFINTMLIEQLSNMQLSRAGPPHHSAPRACAPPAPNHALSSKSCSWPQAPPRVHHAAAHKHCRGA